MDGELRAVGLRQRQLGVHGRGADRHVARHAQVHRLPDARVAIGDERVAVAGILARAPVTDVVPVDPVEPTVGQLDAVDVLERPLRGDLDREHVGTAWLDPRGHVEFVIDVHADDLPGPGDEVAVQPHLGPIVDPGKVQLVGAVAAGRVERGAVPPVLQIQILRDAVEHVRAVVRIRDGAVGPECLEHRRGHRVHLVPVDIAVLRRRDDRTVGLGVPSRRERPPARQLELSRRTFGLHESRQVSGTDGQQDHERGDGAQTEGSAQRCRYCRTSSGDGGAPPRPVRRQALCLPCPSACSPGGDPGDQAVADDEHLLQRLGRVGGA